MLENWLDPIPTTKTYPESALGNHIKTDLSTLKPDAKNVFLVSTASQFTKASKSALYSLKNHFNQLNIYDLGYLKNDNPESVISVLRELVTFPGRVILLSEDQDYTDSIYRALEYQQSHIVMSIVSSHLGNILKERTGRTLQSDNLLNFSALGYQRHYCSPEILNYVYESFAHHLSYGTLQNDIEKAEPILRNSNGVSIDLSVVSSPYAGRPNGLNGLEICQLSKYCGMATSIKVLSIVESNTSSIQPELVGQMLWYFLEGLAIQESDPRASKKEYFQEHIVQTDWGEQSIKFWKSNKTQRWWFEVPSYGTEMGNIYPCRQEDYELACRNEISEYLLSQLNLDH